MSLLVPLTHLFARAACAVVISCVVIAPAMADFRLCNKTTSRIGVAIGYYEQSEWVSEGWWNVEQGACEVLLSGELAGQYYYVYAVDYDRGDEWKGRTTLCTQDKEFIIRGERECEKRGYSKTRYFEVNTGDQKSWTVQLTDSSASKKP